MEIEHINWKDQPVQGLELPDPPPLDSRVIPTLQQLRHHKSWELPLNDMMAIAYGEEYDLDLQVHAVGTTRGVRILTRLHTNPPVMLLPSEDEERSIGLLLYEDWPEAAQRWFDVARFANTGCLPTVNTFWHLCDSEDGVAEHCAIAVRDLPVAVVELHGVLGFGVTGVGMDLSGQIGEAFIRCGYLPPADLSLVDGYDVVNEAIAFSRRDQANQWGGAAVQAEMSVADAAVDRLKGGVRRG